MEPLWSPAVATGGNRWQMRRPRKRLKEPKTLAVGCDRLPESFHGKEGVDGSSPQRALQRRRKSALFLSGDLCRSSNMRWVLEPFMEPSGSGARSKASEMGAFDEGVTQTSLPVTEPMRSTVRRRTQPPGS